MEGPQFQEKIVATESEGVGFLTPSDDFEERATLSYSPSSSQSSQHANKKRTFLEIVNNPTSKRESTHQKQKKEPLLPLTTLLRESSPFIKQPTSSHLSPTTMANTTVVETNLWADSTSFNLERNGNDHNLYSNIGPLSPLMKANPSNSPNLPPLHPLKQPPPLQVPSISQSLPSLSALFGRNLLNSPSPRFIPSSGIQTENNSPSSAPYMLPGLILSDSYNPLNTTSPGQSHQYQQYIKQDQPSQSQQQPQARPINSDVPQIQTGTVRFPLTDRVNALSTGVEHNRFVLLDQPNEIQRKSYKNESRYLLPNPLTICLRSPMGNDNTTGILDGNVSVRIINADGNELPSNMQNILESLGGLNRPLDEERSASFSLKVSATSIGSMYRLLFSVTYRVKGSGSFTETILSTPFSVCSNRKKQLKELKERLSQLQRKT